VLSAPTLITAHSGFTAARKAADEEDEVDHGPSELDENGDDKTDSEDDDEEEGAVEVVRDRTLMEGDVADPAKADDDEGAVARATASATEPRHAHT
jgi:hypothetical protein